MRSLRPLPFFIVLLSVCWLAWVVHVTSSLTSAPSLGAHAARRVDPAGPRRPDVLLITLDTTRADALGAYGAKGDPTPRLDALARAGVRFAHAEAPTPITLPSHASLLSGLYPPEHGVRDNSPHAVPNSVPLVQEAFRAAGYTTAAFVSAQPLARRWGLDRGFALYNDAVTASRSGLSPAERRGERTVDIATQWLSMVQKSANRAPYFLWVHLFDPHHPYEAPKPFADRFPSSPYAAEIAYTDHCVGRLLDALGDDSNTVTIVTADHGESLGEHDEDTHAHLIYRSTRHVPLIVHAAGRVAGGRTIDTPVSLVDIAPTLYDLIDAKPPPHAGRSLLPTLTDERATLDARPLYGESLYDFVHFGWAPLYGIRDGRWHLIEADDDVYLYDVERDPRERTNRASAERAIVRKLARRLDAMRTRFAKAGRGKTREAVRQSGPLGYLQGSAATPMLERDRKRFGKRPNPIDAVPTVRTFETAKARTMTPTQFAQDRALTLLDALLERDADNPTFHYWRGRAKRNVVAKGGATGGRAIRTLDEAIAAFDRCLARRPDHAGAESLAMQCLVLKWAETERAADAQAIVDRARRAAEDDRETQMTLIGLAEVLLAAGPHHDPGRADKANRKAFERFGESEAWRKQRERIDRLIRRARLERQLRPKQPGGGR